MPVTDGVAACVAVSLGVTSELGVCEEDGDPVELAVDDTLEVADVLGVAH